METIEDCCMASHPLDSGRRNWLRAGVGAGSAALMAATVSLVPREAEAASLSQAQRDAMTPDQVIDMMKQGNERFRAGKSQEHDYLAQKRSSAAGQFPAAVILSCIDSRAPAEIILDAGIGDTFNGRIAGNISNRPGEGRKNQDRRLDVRPQ
ncbi:carbonic anhydrase [Achromobacter sp. HZ34]|uniref:carbonic anhydrase n=1 Tax=unclassified Achromobacter TaxID=2626865 RepID=UPI0035143F34